MARRAPLLAPRDNAYYFGKLLSRHLKHQSRSKMRNVAFRKAILVHPVYKNGKMKNTIRPQGNFSSTIVCDSIALCYGRLMDNVALIQLQMNRQDSRIKNEEGALGV